MSTEKMWSLFELIDWTTEFFRSKGIPDPRLDAEVLLAKALGKKRLDLYLAFDQLVPDATRDMFRDFVKKRATRLPIAYITGEREFMGLTFHVNPDVLIPRPETELLVEKVLHIVKEQYAERRALVIDTFTGSGNIAVSIAHHVPNTQVYAIDIDEKTVRCAYENALLHHVTDRVHLLQGDVLQPLRIMPFTHTVDIITANPPYITVDECATLDPEVTCEPRRALDGGDTGAMYYKKLLEQSALYLKPDGYCVMEISPTVKKLVCAYCAEHGFTVDAVIQDYQKLDRIVVARRSNG